MERQDIWTSATSVPALPMELMLRPEEALGALCGMRVLDLGTFIAAPFCCLYDNELRADVTRVVASLAGAVHLVTHVVPLAPAL